MKNLFEKAGIIIDENQLLKFRKYYEVFSFYNEKFNISAIREKEEVYKKNFIDSVIFVDKIKGNKLIDIGSGGGFPAMCLKVMKEDLDVTLVEATGKKCEFLKTLASELDFKNVTVLNKRAEELAFDKDYREKFDVCTARAVASLNILTEFCLPFLRVGGNFVAYKGKASEELENAKNAIKVLGGKVVENNEIELFDFVRTAVIIEKVLNTPQNYPRSNGKIRKRPL